MRGWRSLAAGLAVAAALAVAGTATAATATSTKVGWRDFTAVGLRCSINKTGSALCQVVDGQLEGWTIGAGNWGIDITNPSNKTVWKKRNVGFDRSDVPYGREWQYQNKGIACRRMSHTVGCMLREGSMEGWAFIISGSTLEVIDFDDKVRFRRGSV
jgi:hypothetical protein